MALHSKGNNSLMPERSTKAIKEVYLSLEPCAPFDLHKVKYIWFLLPTLSPLNSTWKNLAFTAMVINGFDNMSLLFHTVIARVFIVLCWLLWKIMHHCYLACQNVWMCETILYTYSFYLFLGSNRWRLNFVDYKFKSLQYSFWCLKISSGRSSCLFKSANQEMDRQNIGF